jgi:hypothetical protein
MIRIYTRLTRVENLCVRRARLPYRIHTPLVADLHRRHCALVVRLDLHHSLRVLVVLILAPLRIRLVGTHHPISISSKRVGSPRVMIPEASGIQKLPNGKDVPC